MKGTNGALAWSPNVGGVYPMQPAAPAVATALIEPDTAPTRMPQSHESALSPPAAPPARAAQEPPRGPWRTHAIHAVIAYLQRPRVALVAALVLVTLIGAADYVTTYEARLAVLYVIPAGLVAWSCGRRWGYVIALCGTIAWAASYATRHPYSDDVYFFWDCAALAATLVILVELVARLHAALARSDERFVRVLDGLYAAIYVTDDDQHVLFANRRLARLMGSEARTPAAAEISARFVPVKPDADDRDDTDAEFPLTGSDARDASSGRRYVLQSGRIPWVDRQRVRLHVLTDVTDQKLAQAMREEHQAALHHTTRLTSMAETATTLAHELNQPLVAIVGYNAACLRLLESGTLDVEALTAAMTKCRAQAVRAGDIVHRLRELAQRRVPQLAPCDLNTMVRQQLAWAENDLERAGVRVEFGLTPALPPVPADRILVEQVLVNLVQNALDAMRDTAPDQRVLRLETRRDERGGVTITVRDRGTGIAPDVAERLFSTFFTTKATGLGLGLGICRSVAEIHGGRIAHAPNPGGGTAFHFTLPGGT